MDGLILFGIFAFIAVLFFIVSYNRLVGKRNFVNKTFAGIDAMSKKRFDLIPNLVSSVQQYMTHERDTLNELTELRTKALTGNVDPNERIKLEDTITKDLSRLVVAVENYPDLKANQNFLQLQRALNEIEEQLAASRRTYNFAVNDYNTAIQRFPTNLVAGMFNFTERELFTITEQERMNVDVKGLFNQ